MRIAFRTNAGKEGLGHLNRIYSLYFALNKQIKIKEFFLVNNFARDRLLKLNAPSSNIKLSEKYDFNDIKILKSFSPDIIVIDTYKASREYLLSIKKELSTLLVLFDDNILFSDVKVDIMINGNIYAQNLDYNGKIKYKKALLGLKYLIMNLEFWNIKKEIPRQVSNMLVTCGGADPKNIMPKLVDWLKNENIYKNIVIGPYFKDKEIELIKKKIDDKFKIIWKPDSLKKFIEESDLVLTTSGSTIYEVLSLNRIPIIFIISEDQVLAAEELEKKGVVNLGWYNELSERLVKIGINKAKDENYRQSLSKIYSLIDGQGALRVASEIIFFYKNYMK